MTTKRGKTATEGQTAEVERALVAKHDRALAESLHHRARAELERAQVELERARAVWECALVERDRARDEFTRALFLIRRERAWDAWVRARQSSRVTEA